MNFNVSRITLLYRSEVGLFLVNVYSFNGYKNWLVTSLHKRKDIRVKMLSFFSIALRYDGCFPL